jgi:hypothetical protein
MKATKRTLVLFATFAAAGCAGPPDAAVLHGVGAAAIAAHPPDRHGASPPTLYISDRNANDVVAVDGVSFQYVETITGFTAVQGWSTSSPRVERPHRWCSS